MHIALYVKSPVKLKKRPSAVFGECPERPTRVLPEKCSGSIQNSLTRVGRGVSSGNEGNAAICRILQSIRVMSRC